MWKSVFLLSVVVTALLISRLEGKPTEVYHHYISHGDCSQKDENDINLAELVVKEYDAEKTAGFNVHNCPKCAIDETYERGLDGEYISCKCIRNVHDLVHGDIKIDDRNRDFLNYAFGRPTISRAAITGERYMWPKVNGVVKVPYEPTPEFMGNSEVAKRFRRAIKAFDDNTCIRFVPRTSEQDYIKPVNQKGCWSFIGRVRGEQEISIGSSCGKDGIVMHELMHSLGFFHEQSRKDRDQYVYVNMQNVLKGFENNFEIASNIENTKSTYDFGSVMHYSSQAFSTNNQPTITRIDGGDNNVMGQRDFLTKYDFDEINAKYCGKTLTFTDKPNTGSQSTTTTSTTIATSTTGGVTDCFDKQPEANCRGWKQHGYCEHTYKDFMKIYCKKTCGLCGGTGVGGQEGCKDKLSGCSSPEFLVHCKPESFYREWMRTYCMKTCKFCSSSEIYTTEPITTTPSVRTVTKPTCGTVQIASTLYARIVGGQNAAVGSIAWQASIQSFGVTVCGGTLISDQWVLTAAHCLSGEKEDYTVYLGLQKRDELGERQVQQFGIKELIKHASYQAIGSGNSMKNDIGLLQLDGRVEYTNYVVPVCLPNRELYLKGQGSLTVSGWGDTAEVGDHSQHLQKVRISLIPRGTCEKWLEHTNLAIDENAFCAGAPEGGKDSCQGDSGGPLTLQSEGRQYIAGIVSWGAGCGRKESPGVYTNVFEFRDWIRDSTGV